MISNPKFISFHFISFHFISLCAGCGVQRMHSFVPSLKSHAPILAIAGHCSPWVDPKTRDIFDLGLRQACADECVPVDCAWTVQSSDLEYLGIPTHRTACDLQFWGLEWLWPLQQASQLHFAFLLAKKFSLLSIRTQVSSAVESDPRPYHDDPVWFCRIKPQRG